MGQATRERPAAWTHQPPLDGLRCLAVAAVLLYHSGLSWLPGGFLGVDAFFVLSGYLITSLLILEFHDHGRIRLGAFWGRRARRLLPALFLLLLGVAAYATFVARPDELGRIRGDGIATLFYAQNWRLIFSHQSYFDQFVVPSPLRHAWSLAIEEQWYLVWPLVLGGLLWLGRGRLGRVLVVVVGLAIGSALWMAVLYSPSHDPSRVYYGTDTRAQSLLVGSALGLALRSVRGPVSRRARMGVEAAGLAGAAYLVWLVTHVSENDAFLFRGGSLVAALAAAAVVAAAVQPSGSLLRRGLSLGPLCAIGLISYGIYLFHWPVYLTLTPDRVGLDGFALLGVRVAVTLVIATASYLLVELPVRRGVLRARSLRFGAPVAAAAVVSVMLLVVTAGSVPAGPARLRGQLEAAASGASGASAGSDSAGFLRRLHYISEARTTPPGVVRVLVAGDSAAFTLGDASSATFDRLGIRGATAGILGCGLAGGKAIVNGRIGRAPPYCATWATKYREASDAFDPDVAVLMLGAWEIYDRVVDGKTLPVGSAGFSAYVRMQLERARRALTAHGAQLVVLTTPCFAAQDPGVVGTVDRQHSDPRRLEQLNRVWRQFAAEHPADVSIADLGAFLCPRGQPLLAAEGQPARSDAYHFTSAGARATWRWLAPIAVQLARTHPRPQRAPAR